MNSRKKWMWFVGLALLLAGVTVFFWRATSRSPAPVAVSPPKTGADNPEHELKALAAQLEKKPGHTPVLMRMAQIERDRGKLDAAAGHLRKAIETEPANPDAHLELGRILYEKGDVTGAIAETAKALEANPKHVDALYNMGAIYANAGDPVRARSYWKKAAVVDPSGDSGKKAREGLARIGGS